MGERFGQTPHLPPEWRQLSRGYFLRDNGIEVSCVKLTNGSVRWVAIVPMYQDGFQKISWTLLRDDAFIKLFTSADDAISTAEYYLDIFHQFSQTCARDSVDVSQGKIRMPGGEAGDLGYS